LTELPESIGNLINLQVLSCDYNHLQQLPKTPVSTCESIASANGCFGNLINLQRLYCNSNQLKYLPESIASANGCFGNLINLQVLYCGYNKLRELPESIGNLIKLQQLYCKKNTYNDNFQNIICNNKYNQAQEMLQALRDAYLIPTDNSYILK
jgi:Leucine-rich repeat (LRR) protein